MRLRRRMWTIAAIAVMILASLLTMPVDQADVAVVIAAPKVRVER